MTQKERLTELLKTPVKASFVRKAVERMKLLPSKYIKIQPQVVAPGIPSGLGDDFVYRFQAAIHAKVVDLFDKEIIKAIQQYCLENGYTDLVLIDEEFIRAAIEHEIQRRESYATSAPIRRNDENP